MTTPISQHKITPEQLLRMPDEDAYELVAGKLVERWPMTTATIPQRQSTPEELLTMPDEAAYELVDGNLVERHMGTESSEIALKIAFLLQIFLQTRPLGRLFGSDAGYKCFPDDPKKIRRADVGFVRFERLPSGRAPKGYCTVAPDLAIEVISPNDTAEEVDEKINEYLLAGVRLIWIVSPSTRTVRIHRPRTAENGPISILSAEESISGEDVLPGFACPISKFFETAQPPAGAI